MVAHTKINSSAFDDFDLGEDREVKRLLLNYIEDGIVRREAKIERLLQKMCKVQAEIDRLAALRERFTR